MTKKKWKPKVGEQFWTIRFSLCLGMLNSFCVKPDIDQIEYKSTNSILDFPLGIYRTKSEAQAAIRAIKKTVRSL